MIYGSQFSLCLSSQPAKTSKIEQANRSSRDPSWGRTARPGLVSPPPLPTMGMETAAALSDSTSQTPGLTHHSPQVDRDRRTYGGSPPLQHPGKPSTDPGRSPDWSECRMDQLLHKLRSDVVSGNFKSWLIFIPVTFPYIRLFNISNFPSVYYMSELTCWECCH